MALFLRLGALFRRNPAGVLFAAMLLLAGAPFGVLYASLVPIGQGADEQLHAMRAYSLSQGEFTGHLVDIIAPDGAVTPTTSVVIDPMLASVLLESGSGTTMVITLSTLVMIDNTSWSDLRGPAGVHTIGSYFPIFHLPAAAVMALARPLNIFPAGAVRLARFVDLGVVLLLGAAALLLAGHGRAVLLAVLLLPMTLSLAATLTSDGPMLATAVLAAALLTRDDARLRPGDRWPSASWWWAAAAILAVGLAKPPYVPLLGVLLLPLPRWRDWRLVIGGLSRRILLVAGLCLPILAWAAYISLVVVGEAHRFDYHPGPWWPGSSDDVFRTTERGLQLGLLLSHPVRILQLAAAGLGGFRAMDLIGVLGRLDAALPDWLYSLWTDVFVVAVLTELVAPRKAGHRFRLDDMVLLAVCIGLAGTAICVSLYLSWTPVGFDHAEGVQGRYLLPFAPFLVLALPRLAIPGASVFRGIGLVAPGLAAIAGCVAMPYLFLFYYYLR